MIHYDDNGNLILSGKLGEAVVNNDFEAFTKAQISGKSEDGLTYQDMADFNEFISEFFRLGKFPDREGAWNLILMRKSDQAPFGLVSPLITGGVRWVSDQARFRPMQPFQGYEPAE